MEAVYAKPMEGGHIGLARIEEKPFEWFLPGRDGSLRYFNNLGTEGIEGKEVDTRFKFFLTRRQATYRNPYGEAILSRLYWPWFFRSQGMKFWARFLERFGQPLLVGYTDGNRSELADSLLTAVQDAVVAVGSGDKVEAVAPGNAGENFNRFESAMEKRIQKVILGQTLTTDVDGKGSYAAANVHDRVRGDRRQSDLRLVTDTVQRIVNALTILNFPATEPPKFVMEDAQGLETDRAERDVNLAKANTSLRFTQEYYRDVFGLDAEHFQLVEASKPSSMIDDRFAQFADDGTKFTPDQQEIEELADSALAQTSSPIPLASIKAAIDAATDPEDLAERLAKLVGEESSEMFQGLLERALFTADVLGYGNAEQQKGEEP